MLKKIIILGMIFFGCLGSVNAQTRTATEGYVDRSVSNAVTIINTNLVTKPTFIQTSNIVDNAISNIAPVVFPPNTKLISISSNMFATIDEVGTNLNLYTIDIPNPPYWKLTGSIAGNISTNILPHPIPSGYITEEILAISPSSGVLNFTELTLIGSIGYYLTANTYDPFSGAYFLDSQHGQYSTLTYIETSTNFNKSFASIAELNAHIITPEYAVKLISISSNMFATVDEVGTNLNLYNITSSTPIWLFTVDGYTNLTEYTSIPYPLPSDPYIYYLINGGNIQTSLGDPPLISIGVELLDPSGPGNAFIDPYTGGDCPSYYAGNYVLTHLRPITIVSTNLVKTFSSIAELNDHITNSNIHITSQERTNWNDKVSLATLYSNTTSELIVDSLGRGTFSTITEACAYADAVHATNALLEINIRIVAGTYYEHPVLNLPRTILRGDNRRSKLWGSLTVKENPTYISGMYFRSNADGEVPLIFNGVTSSTIGYLSDCYILNARNFAGTAYCLQVTNSPNLVLGIMASEFYSQNSNADILAKSVVILLNDGHLEVINTRMKTTSHISNVYENEYMAWMYNSSQIQMENSYYISVHDTQTKVHTDGESGVLWIEGTAINAVDPNNHIIFEGTSTNPVVYYAKEVGSLNIHGNLSVANIITATNMFIITGTTSNRVLTTYDVETDPIWTSEKTNYAKITDIPESAFRIMIASNILMTVDGTNADIWEITPIMAWKITIPNDVIGQVATNFYSDAPNPMQYGSWRGYNVFDDNPPNGATYGYLTIPIMDSSPNYYFPIAGIRNYFTNSGEDYGYMEWVVATTNFMFRLASTNDINTQLLAYLASEAYTINDFNVASGAATEVLNNHTQNQRAHPQYLYNSEGTATNVTIVGGTLHGVNISGDGTSLSNVNAKTVEGYTIDQIMAVGSTYFFGTNIVNYGVITGRIASIELPTVGGFVTYTGPVVDGQYIASYLIPYNQMPGLIPKGTKATFNFHGGHAGTPSQHPTIMGDFYIYTASNGVKIQEFESPIIEVPRGEADFKLEITFTNDVIKDGFAFLLRTKIINDDNYTGDYKSYYGKPYFTGFSFPKTEGVYEPVYKHDEDIDDLQTQINTKVDGNTTTSIVTSILSPIYNATKELTGFESPDLLTVVYTNRMITLTSTANDIPIWWRGVRSVLPNPFYSTQHPVDAGLYYLAGRTSTNFEWSTSPWTFDMLQASYVFYREFIVGFRECHGLMQWQVHEDLHRNIGTYRLSGGYPIIGTYGINANTPNNASNSPSFSEAVIDDEDLKTSVAQWNDNRYSLLFFTGSNTVNILTNSPTMFKTNSATYPVVNTFSGGQFTTNTTVANRFLCYYQILMPVTASTNSQEYRMLILQPQTAHTTLALAQAEDFRSLNLGELSVIFNEFTVFTKMIFDTANAYNSAGKVRLIDISYITGSKATTVTISQLNVPNTANAISTDVSRFDSALSEADTTVQLALDTLDNAVTNLANKLLYADINTINQSISPATTRVEIVSEKTIYKVNISNLVILAFDMSSLNFTNKEVSFRLDLNITHTNGFGITFPLGWSFIPELTVTGEYRFAVSAASSNVLQVSQVFPSIYDWTSYMCGARNGALAANPALWVEASNDASTNDYNVVIGVPKADQYYYAKYYYWPYTATSVTNPPIIYTGWGYVQTAPTTLNVFSTNAILSNGSGLYGIIPPFLGNDERNHWLYFYAIKRYKQGRWQNAGIRMRVANELEIKAYQNGWTPAFN